MTTHTLSRPAPQPAPSARPAAGELALPLVVDLDGTLIRSDMLFETANHFLTRHPGRALQLAAWALQPRSVLKRRLAQAHIPDPASLPYHQPLLAWLREQQAAGRRLVLATASHRLLADAVASHLGLFDEVLATEGEVNLKSSRKRDLLVARFGESGFDYVGNEEADMAVWAHARTAHMVSRSRALIAKAHALGNLGRVFVDERPAATASLLKAMRPHQWVKNLLVIVPLLTAHRYGDLASVLHALLAFVAFGMTASSVYLLNDMADVADDRHHPSKRHRPFAAGQLSLLHGWLAWPLLLLAAFGLSLATLPMAFTATLAVYFVLTLAYSLGLKQGSVIDVLTLAGLYTLRIIAGAAAVAVPLSFWLLTFSMFIFLSLAFMKRFSELRAARHAGQPGKLRGRGYQQGDLELVSSFGTAAGYLSVLVLALYIQDSATATLYHAPRLIWLACPLLLYWISRAWLIAHRGEMNDDPIVFAIRDRASWVTGGLLVGIFSLSRVLG